LNLKQIVILIIALAVIVLLLWQELPLEFPGVMLQMLRLFVKIAIVVVLTFLAYIFAGRKKSSSYDQNHGK